MANMRNGTTKRTLKTGIAILSVAATLGAWAALARNDAQTQTVALNNLNNPQPVVRTLALPPVPTVVRPPAAAAPSAPSVQGSPALNLPPIPAVSAPVRVVRPVARTRSSR